MGDPDEVLWFAEGRPATRDEVLQALGAEVEVLRELTRQGAGGRTVDEELSAIDAAYALALGHVTA